MFQKLHPWWCKQIPEYWLENPNLHRLITTGKLTTLDLTKRLYLIFLWAELSRRATIPIPNPLLYTVYIVGGWQGAHSYSALLKNNKETDCFRNRLLSLCWIVQNVITIWNIFGRINDECIWNWIVDRHWNVFLITWWPTNRKWRVVL